MKLEQLTYVLEVANTQSISKAASNLLISQPGLSSSIKQLETELGVELFVRNRKGVELTEMGNSFLIYAKRILDHVNSLENLCKGNPSPVFQSLFVASDYFRFSGIVLAMLVNKYKPNGTRFVIRNGVTRDCISWVSEGVCDVGLVYFRAEDEKTFRKRMQRRQLNYKTIYQTPINVIIGAGHPLYHTDITEISLKELEKYTMLAHDQTAAKDYFRSVFLHADLQSAENENLRVLVTDQSALYEMLEFTDCYCLGFTNDIVYKNIPGPHKLRNLKLLDRQSPFIMNVAWIAPASMEHMPLVKEYIQLITDVCTQENFWELHPDMQQQLPADFQ